MKIIYYDTDEREINFSKPSIFLGGPTPRSHLKNSDGTEVKSWRPDFIDELKRRQFDGLVFVPEPSPGKELPKSYDAICQWESDHLEMATAIAFWIPRDLATLPGFTTNVEFGYWLHDKKMFYGRPPGAPKTRYLDFMYKLVHAYDKRPKETMGELANVVLEYSDR